jgi:hypothetical protein
LIPDQMQPGPPYQATAAPTGTLSPGLRVDVDMTVEVAMSVMRGARADELLLCDEDDECTGLVTWAELAVFRDSPSYTDLVRLRDVVGLDRTLGSSPV